MDITQLVIGVIGICVLFVTLVILPLARAKFGNENVDEFLRWVKIGVQAAEQIYSITDGELKKMYVLEFLDSKGYDINEDEVDKAIEAAVLELHTAMYGVTYERAET